ncbi:MAG TPA: hypothetical protein VMM82_04210 [Spirochaetia bacterium]|nr:hypothetical protein [Spirochaetia bacterium]
MSMKVAAIVITFSCFLLARCATGPSIYREVVQGPSGADVTAATVTIHVSQDPSGNIDVIRLTRVSDPQDVSYLVRITYGGPNRRFMAGPITLRMAGHDVELETETDGTRQTLQGPVPPECVEELFAADEVSILYGGRPALLSAAEIEALRALKRSQP